MFKRLLNLLKPYLVVIQSGAFDGTKHKAWTQSDALEWAACYPNECQVYVFSRRGLTRSLSRFNNVVLFRQGLR
jgi:hypothetical protein